MAKTVFVPKITSKDERWHKRQGYRSGHIAGNKAEIKAVGKHQFDKLNRQIQRLPKGRWAATHTERGDVHISREFINMLPKKERSIAIKELRIHEKTEHRKMKKKNCKK